ncbi:hypothetical protein M1307_00080, partial [Patescibacteria group bacterium]|nr:hypothetical protein [Patescibacteria group bacterium]
MNSFGSVIVFVLKTLIAIGDLVLAFIDHISRILNKLFSQIKNLPNKIERSPIKKAVPVKTIVAKKNVRKYSKKPVKIDFWFHRVKIKSQIKLRLFLLKIKRAFKKDISSVVKAEKKAVKEVVLPIRKVKKTEERFERIAGKVYDKIRKSRLRRLKKLRKIRLRLPFEIKFRYFFIGTFFSFLFFFLPLLFFVFVLNLPNPSDLTLKEVAQSTKIYDRNDNLLYQIYANQNRTI